MINSITMFSIYLSIILSVFVPVFAVSYGFIKRKLNAGKFLFGILLFLLLRMLVLSPLAALFSSLPVFSDLLTNAFFAAMISALLITLVDVFGKRIGYKYLIKDTTSFKDILSIALGQGVAEVFLTLSWRTFNSLLMANVINNGTITDVLAETYSSSEIAQIIAETSAIHMDAYLYLGIGALCIIVMHIIVAFLVMQAINRKDNRYILFAIALLLVFNSTTYTLPLYSYLLTIIILMLFTAGIAYLAYKKKLFNIMDSDNVITV